MAMFKFRGILAGCLLFPGLAVTCLAQERIDAQQNEFSLPYVKELETGILRNVTGYKGDVLGAEIISVTAAADNSSEIIEISVPVDPELADRVVVISPTGRPLKLDSPLELTLDQENSKVGIILRQPGKSKLEFRIKLIDLPDE